MARRVVSKGRRTVVGKPTELVVSLDDSPIALWLAPDGKRAAVVLPYEIWVINATNLDVEKTIELPLAHPSLTIGDSEGTLYIGGQHLYRGSLFSANATKVGTKLGGYVDRVCMVGPRLLCGVGSHGEVLRDLDKEADHHRRKTSERHVYGLVGSPDGRAIFADGSPHAWVIDPDHTTGYMKLKLKRTSEAELDDEGIVALGQTTTGRTLLAARDGAVAWTNRALRIEGERMPKGSSTQPIALSGDATWVYVLRTSGLLHRFLIRPPTPPKDSKETPPELPPAQTVRLKRMATSIAVGPEGKLLLAGPHADDQLGRIWKEDPDKLEWEDLALGERELVEAPPSSPSEAPKKPDFTQVRSKLTGPAISTIKVDDVLAAKPSTQARFWVTRHSGTVLERPTGVLDPDAVLGGDTLLLPAMFRLQEGTARPGLVLWPGVPQGRPVPIPPIQCLTWGDDPRGWLVLETPSIRQQGWSRRQVFPLQVALAHAAPEVAGRRPKLPSKWTDRELFDALVKECKTMLKVLW